MLFANNPLGTKIRAEKNVDGLCPACGESLIAKCGKIKVWHWSHFGSTDCDKWHEPMTAWHIDWQDRFPFDGNEVWIKRGDEIHRADIQLASGIVVEFQHSPISVDEIRERELFYQRMIWVFDVGAAFKANRFSIYKRSGFETFIWKHSRESIESCQRPVVFCLGNGQVFRCSKIHPHESESWGEMGGHLKSKPMGGWGNLISANDFVDMLNKGKRL